MTSFIFSLWIKRSPQVDRNLYCGLAAYARTFLYQDVTALVAGSSPSISPSISPKHRSGSSNKMLNIKRLLFYTLLLACLILAHPQDGSKGKGEHKGKGCLTDREAYDIIQLFFSFFEAGFDPSVAERTLTEDFVEQSGGLNFLTGQNVRCIPAIRVYERSAHMSNTFHEVANFTTRTAADEPPSLPPQHPKTSLSRDS